MLNKRKKPLKCPSCNEPFQSKKSLEGHCINHHKKPLEELQAEKDRHNRTLEDFEGDQTIQKSKNPFGQSFDQKQYENSTPLEIVINKPAKQDIYCVKCRKKVFTECTYKKLKNGTYAVVSVHHGCGTLMYKFTGIRETSTRDLGDDEE